MTDPENTSPGPLSGLRIVEFASFVAGPSGGMSLAQLGADVIRVDPIGGNIDYRRWPLASSGDSFYWTSLNRGKRSVAIDVRSAEGRELLLALATAPGPDAGLVVDNNVGRPWFSYQVLAQRRADVIRIHIEGTAGGGAAVDYTVNTAVGIADMTGPADSPHPVNHVLPAWDLIAGQTATTALLAALHRRNRSGAGSYVQIALADVALAAVANLGWLSEAAQDGNRARHGNYMYGSFGVDFATSDGRRLMLVALTPRQWTAIGLATGTANVFAALEESLSADFATDEGRYAHREVIAAVLRPWFAAHTFDETDKALTDAGALWGPYRTMAGVVADHRAGTASETVLVDVEQPGIGSVISSSSPVRFDKSYSGSAPAARLGQHTDDVLSEVLGLSDADLGRLHDAGTVS
ncbi:CoA transferase [Gordonia sp. CPCC 205333]|uniref:CoA transferase n=1 Tax=Gordonia sp. CPCC 205333 TaxID=3140790 RepID=UPI003AF38F65